MWLFQVHDTSVTRAVTLLHARDVRYTAKLCEFVTRLYIANRSETVVRPLHATAPHIFIMGTFTFVSFSSARQFHNRFTSVAR